MDPIESISHLIMNSSDGSLPAFAARSVGHANELFFSMIQTMTTAYCLISPSEMWPADYGSEAMKHSELIF